MTRFIIGNKAIAIVVMLLLLIIAWISRGPNGILLLFGLSGVMVAPVMVVCELSGQSDRRSYSLTPSMALLYVCLLVTLLGWP